MIYKLILGKQEIEIDEEEKKFFVESKDKRFIELKSGEIINTAFVQGIVIDEELSKEENRARIKLTPKGTFPEEERENLIKVIGQEGKKEVKGLNDLLQKYTNKLLE